MDTQGHLTIITSGYGEFVGYLKITRIKFRGDLPSTPTIPGDETDTGGELVLLPRV